MAKFLILGDVHMRTATPEMRTEPEFDKVCLGKLEWCLSQAVQRECEAVLCPGDFFDSSTPTPKLLIQLVNLFNTYEVPVITTIGNHDVAGKTTSNYDYSPLALFSAMSAMIVLTGGEFIDLNDTSKTIRIYGYGYGEEVTEKLISGRIIRDDSVFSIALVHASIGNNLNEAQYDINDLNIKGADMCVIGDIHSGWEGAVTHKSGCECFNCGCLIRLRSTEADYIPRCLILDTDTMTVERLVVPHLPSSECFDIKRIESRVTGKLQAFNAAYERSREIQTERPDDMVRRVGRAAEFEEGIIDLVVKRLP